MPEPPAQPSDARTVQWAPNGPAIPGAGKPAQASIGACDACRARKVRCLASEDSSSKCQRCTRASRECVYTVHSKTRRRKRTDTRVKELEEKVKNLSVLLEQGRTGSTQASSEPSKQTSLDPDDGMDDEYEEMSDEEADGEGDENVGAFDIESTWHDNPKAPPAQTPSTRGLDSKPQPSFTIQGMHDGTSSSAYEDAPDVVDRGVLSMKEATRLFDRYVNLLAPNYPGIAFQVGTTAASVRKERPILFLAVIAAAASTADPGLNLKLNQEILQLYATNVALQGQKSIDLVQSLLISSLWYYPPERFDQLKFHQYIHMAATMALDLGLGKRPRTRRPRPQHETSHIPDYEPQKPALGKGTMCALLKPAPDSSTIESRRTLLACYLQCASVSLSLRLPNALRFTSHMSECLDVLESSPDAAPTDRRFVAWVRIQRIIEECVNSFSLDDPESTVTLSDVRNQNLLKGFEKQLAEWRKGLKPGVSNGFLEVNYHVNNIFMHEISLHPDHEPEDFRPPFYVATQLTSKIPTDQDPAYVNAIMECVSSAQSVFKLYLGMSIETIRALPALIYVRVLYCCVVLIKIEVSMNAPSSELGNILDQQSLNVSAYLQRLLVHHVTVVGKEGRNVGPAKFLMILKRLIGWYHTYRSQLATGDNAHHPFEPATAMDPSTSAQPQGAVKQPDHPVQVNLQQPTPPPQQQQALPDFNTIPQQTSQYQPFSNISPRNTSPHPERQQQHHQQYTHIPNLAPFAPPAAPPKTSQPTYDYHGAMLASSANANSPPTDYSSPENNNAYYQNNSTGSPSSSGMAASSNPEDNYGKMEVDPNMFGQLQDMEPPFGYNPDMSTWSFDFSGIDMGMGMGMEQGGFAQPIPDFEWNNLAPK